MTLNKLWRTKISKLNLLTYKKDARADASPYAENIFHQPNIGYCLQYGIVDQFKTKLN
jgi:hypothetical protein